MPASRLRARKFFVDANILLYVHDRREAAKGGVVRRWLRELTDLDCVRLNLQVLNEVTNVMLRKHWFDSPLQVYAIIDEFTDMGAEPIGWKDVEIGRLLHAKLYYSWWDCLLLASALELGCSHFLSEDLQDGQRVEADGKALTIVDPFAHSPEQILASR